MTPEEKARVKIDQMFENAGWQVVDKMAKMLGITDPYAGLPALSKH